MDNIPRDFYKYIGQTSANPIGLRVKDSKGEYIYDQDGKRYLDLVAGITVCNLGHQHPAIVTAIEKQLQHYTHTMVYGEHIQSPQVRFARQLSQQLPDPLQMTYFITSGSEAIEASIKLAKRYTGNSKIVSFKKGYHGSTHGAMSITGNKTYRQKFAPLLPDVHFIQFNRRSDLSAIDKQTAAVIVEPIQGEAGVRIPRVDYLKELRARCDKTNTLLVFDECQTGFGRTGQMFAFEHFSVVPDILVMAKAMGGGLPLGGIAASPQLMKTFQDNPPLAHLTTFGGHPLSCAAGEAHLRTLMNQSLMQQTASKVDKFEQQLTHSSIQDLRHIGLFIGIELPDKNFVQRVAHKCLEMGGLVHWFLFAPHCLRIAPPLNISEESLVKGGKLIQESIEEVA